VSESIAKFEVEVTSLVPPIFRGNKKCAHPTYTDLAFDEMTKKGHHEFLLGKIEILV